MEGELQDLIISLKKQNANSVFELLKAQKRMADLEKKVKSLEKAIGVLIDDNEHHMRESKRLTIEKLRDIKSNL